MFAVGGCCSVLPPLLLLDPHAVTATAASAAIAPNFIDFLPPLVEDECVVCRPGESHRPAFEPFGVSQGVHILTYRDKVLAALEAHHVSGANAHVDHLLDLTRLDGHAGRGRLALREHPDLLRADDEAHAISDQHVRDADEPGDELGRGSFVDLDGRADLFDLAARHDRDAV